MARVASHCDGNPASWHPNPHPKNPTEKTMKMTRVLMVLLCGIAAPAFAQQSALAGNWTAKWEVSGRI